MEKIFCKLALMIALVFLSTSAVSAQTSERDLGFEQYQQGNYQKAIEHFQKAVEFATTDREAWEFLAAANAKLDRKGEAKKAFEASLKLVGAFYEGDSIYDKKPKIKKAPQPPVGTSLQGKEGWFGMYVLVEFIPGEKPKLLFIDEQSDKNFGKQVREAVRGIKVAHAMKNGVEVSSVHMMGYAFMK